MYRNLKPGERIDDLERNGLKIIQNSELFCFGMDAVLLSGFVSVKKNETAVDLGTGTGIIPILLSAKTCGKHFIGVEIQPAVADMARRSVELNGIGDMVEIIEGDIREIATGRKASDTPALFYTSDNSLSAIDSREDETLPRTSRQRSGGASERETSQTKQASLIYGSYDVVTSNPPYMKSSHGLTNPEDTKAISRHEVMCTLSDVCVAASRLLKSGGRFYMVHRPLRLPEIITELKKNHLEPKRMKFVHPFIDKEANMVLIEAVKGAGAECRIEKPIIVYEAPGKYTEEIYTIYGY